MQLGVSERVWRELFKSSYVVCKFWICPRLASIKRITTFVRNIFNTGVVISGMFSGAFTALCLLTCQSVLPLLSLIETNHIHTLHPSWALTAVESGGVDCANSSTLAWVLSMLGAWLSQGPLRAVYLNGLCFPVTPLRAGRSLKPFHPESGPPQVSPSQKTRKKKRRKEEEGEGERQRDVKREVRGSGELSV